VTAQEHRTIVTPSSGYGAMRGWRWECLCGRKGASRYQRALAEAGGAKHEARQPPLDPGPSTP
jgi:hypothetical protein